MEVQRNQLRNILQMKNKHTSLKFTGERLIPTLNEGAAFYYEHIARYFLACQYTNYKTILDAGCGTGYGSYLIGKYGQGKQIQAVDLSPQTIAFAKENYGKSNIDFHIDNILRLKTIKDKTIDLAISFEVIEHIAKQNTFLSQIKRVLKNNGIFIVSTPNVLTYPKGNKYHLKELKPNEFKQLLSKYFKNIIILNQNFFISQEINIPNNKQNDIDLKNNQKFFKQKQINLKQSKKLSTCEYLIALCSDKSIRNPTPVSISLESVDNFDLTEGIISLSKQFNELIAQKDNIKMELDIIKSSKFFKLWPLYEKIKNILKK